MIGPSPFCGQYEKSTGRALYWKMINRRNLYIFDSGRGDAGYRIGKHSHMMSNGNGLFKSKRIIVFSFCILGKEMFGVGNFWLKTRVVIKISKNQ